MLDYKTITEAYSFAEKSGFKDEDTAGQVVKDYAKKATNVIKKGVNTASTTTKDLYEKGKKTLNDVINKPKVDADEYSKHMGKLTTKLIKQKQEIDQLHTAKGALGVLGKSAKDAAEQHPAVAGAIGALAAGAGALGLKRLWNKRKQKQQK